MENIKISIITVCFNAASSIEETIKSVINQTYNNIEYIIIDGGSKDGTLDIIDKYSKYVTHLVSEPDKGIYDAMNKGIELATGRYVNFMNAGDVFSSDSIISKIEFNNAAVIYGNVIKDLQDYRLTINGKPINTIKQRLPFCHQSSFTKTELLKNDKFNLQYKIAADYNFFYRLYKAQYSFSYQDIDISIFEGISGISSTSLKNLITEYSLISGIPRLFYWEWWKINISDLIKYILPNKIVKKIKEKRLNYSKRKYNNIK